MILHRAFREAPLDGWRPAAAEFSAAEERYVSRAASPEGSRAARHLAKALLSELLQARGVPHAMNQLEILPLDAGACDTVAAAAYSGPPEFRLPPGLLPDGWRLHVSLSHSRTHAAALLVVEGVTQPDHGGAPQPR